MNRMPRRQETELEWILRLKADLYSYILIIVLRSEACNHFFIWLYFIYSPATSLKPLKLLLTRAKSRLLSMPCETVRLSGGC